MKYTYLLINICSIAIPFAFSFESKLKFYKKWKVLVPAILIPAIFFLIWDSIFTTQGVWGFNENYLTGIKLLNLPLEEVLFFLCIPYCCVFTYEVLNHFIKKDVVGKYARYGTTILTYILAAMVFNYHELAYTFYTALLTAIFLLVHLVYLKKAYWSRLVFAYLIILIPFFIVNGILTGTGLEEPVVWYNDAENLGIRLLTIPIEDSIYGFLLISSNISLYEWGKTNNE
ncbi:MAG: lycopene cyclase domain-containing protein [Flavobacteriales bacterium]|nr:lycopene cyclase domain-containing protein [Flavobacteriales bacterium]